jgi:hypothetical protein
MRPNPQSAIRNPQSEAVPPPGNQIMHASEVREGMKGYGLTVFHGTKIERFDVEVIGVLERTNMGRPLVLVRFDGGPISKRGAYLIHGMSGSPIYLNGKLLGAFSQGDNWPKEPIGMVTPIEDMLEALDPKLPQQPAGSDTAADPLTTNRSKTETGATSGGDLFSLPSGAPARGLAGSFTPMSVPLAVSGLSRRNLERLGQALQPLHMSVMQGGGAMGKPFRAELVPGAAVGVSMMTGDVDIAAFGTVTYRDGDKILAFGHPFTQLGPTQFPMTTAWIHDVFPGLMTSYKIASSGEMVGTMTQDRPFSIAGRMGPVPAMIPVSYTVNDKTTGRTKSFHVKTVNHPLMVGRLLPIAVDEGLYEVRPVPGDATAHVKMRVETEGAGTILRDNVYFDPAEIDVACVRELAELMGILSNNPFRKVPVKSIQMDVTYEDKRPTAVVERVFLSQDRVQPGEEVEVGVVLRPYRKDPLVTKTKIKIPESAASGRAVVLIQGGNTRVNLSSLLMASAPSGPAGFGQPQEASLKETLKRFASRERNDQIVTHVIFPTTAVNIAGQRLAQLPSTIVDVMRSSKTTGLRLERDEVRAVQDCDYIVDGFQSLQVNIEKPSPLEKPQGSGPGGPSTPEPGSVGGPSGAQRTTLSVGPDEDDLEAITFTVNGQPHTIRLTTPEEGDDEADDPPKPRAPARPEAKPAKKPAEKTQGKTTEPLSKAVEPDEKPDEKPAGTTADGKLVGRQATIWTQTSQADFERGTMKSTSVTSRGEVRLSPSLKLLEESSEQYIWSVVGMNGCVYAGTGNGGTILKTDADGKTSVFCKTGELEVHALARDASGALYAGTSPGGKLLRVGPDGKAAELLSMNGERSTTEAGSKFVLALAVAPDGTVYAGTGPEGRIFRVRPGAAAAEEICKLPVKSVMSLLVAPNGALYAGTAEDGAVYRIEPGPGAANPTVLYDTNQASVTGLALDKAGNLYLGCAPSGDVYRIEPDGTPRAHFEKGRAALFGLVADAEGNLYTCSAGTLMQIQPDGSSTLIGDRKVGQFTCLAWDDQGHLVAGSSNVGSVYRVTPTTSGSFESTVHDAKLPSKWGRIRYTGILPAGGSLTVQTRSGNSPNPGDSWSAWQDAVARDGGQFVASPPARYLQYRVLLKAERGSPGLRDIAIAYLPPNQAPKLTLSTPTGGEMWRGSQSVKWAASDPDGDTLTYEIAYSGDGGRTWKPVGEKTVESAPAPAAPAAPSTGPTPNASANDALSRYRKQLDEDASLTPQQRSESYEKAKGLIQKYLTEHPGEPTDRAPAPPRPGAPAAVGGAPATGSTRQATITWDTRQVPDGLYLLRIIATDRASNPSDARVDQKTTEPIIVCNTPPQLFVFERGIAPGMDSAATVVGFAAGRVGLKGAEYRLGSTGDWTAVEAEDGIWDSAFEHFRFPVKAQGSGPQTVEIKVVDAAGNVSVTQAKFQAP